MRKTRIIATVGPSCRSPAALKALVKAGVDIFRVNTSHAEPAEVRGWILKIRKLGRSLRKKIPVMLDLQGPRIRTGPLKDARPLDLKPGQTVWIRPGDGAGSGSTLTTRCRMLPGMVKKGDPILLDNGTLQLKVVSKNKTAVRCRVISGGRLGENKGINLPRAPLVLPALSEKDVHMLTVAVKHSADFIALSFVRHEEDVAKARDLLMVKGSRIPLIAKIEKPMALSHLPAILAISDGLMVARGDLGIELGMEKVPVIQKKLIWLANRNQVPVITATQMLESMMVRRRPLRAEVSDVANAVFDGTDMVMLSGETAVGKYPVETVRMMVKIILEAEGFLNQTDRTS